MNSKIINDLSNIAKEIKARIQAYADLHNISFEEAEKRAKLTIAGQDIKIGNFGESIRIEEINKDSESDPI